MKNKPISMATSATATTSVATSSVTSDSKNDTNSSSKMYKGVRKRKWGKWVSEIRLPNSRERIWLGSYDTQEKAARAFDAALYCLRGRNASFNFPDTPLNFEINCSLVESGDCHSLSHHEIQEVAQKFANEIVSPSPIESDENNNNNSQEGGGGGEEEEGEDGANSRSLGLFESSNNNDNPSSLFSPLYDYDGSMEVDSAGDRRAMDWTFLNVLDHHHDDSNYNNIGVYGYDFGLYCGLDKVQYSGEFLYSTPQPTIFEDSYNGEGTHHQGDDAFSYSHSFLWSWNF